MQLPTIVANAHAGLRSISTRHGKPYAAVVPLEDVPKSAQQTKAAAGLLAPRGSGRGLWGNDIGQTVSELRDEWEDA